MRDIEVKLTEMDNNEKRNQQLINANVYIITGFIKWLVCMRAYTHTPYVIELVPPPPQNLFSTW